jgi:transposase
VAVDPKVMVEILIGLENVNVIEVKEDENGTNLKVTVETKNTKAICVKCKTKAKLKDRPVVKLYDLTSFGRKVELTWIKRRFYCPNDNCEVKSFTEDAPNIANPRSSLSDRAARFATYQVGKNGRTITEIARELGCSWHAVNNAVMAYGEVLLEASKNEDCVKSIGLDEALFVKRGKYRKQNYSTQIVDVGKGTLLDIVPGRSGDEAKKWFESKPDDFKSNIEYGTLDLSSPYRSVYNQELPHVIQVADPFHVIKLANSKLDECRRRVQNETIGHRGRKNDPLYRCRKLLLMANESIEEKGHTKRLGLLKAGDPNGEVETARKAKEAVRELYSHADKETASRWLDELANDMQYETNPIEVKSLGRTLVRWKSQIIAWHESHITNAATEGINNLVKRIKRIAFGFTNFENYRIRSLLYSGKPNWQLLSVIQPH